MRHVLSLDDGKTSRNRRYGKECPSCAEGRADYGMGRYTLASAYAGKALAQKDPKEAEKLIDEAFKAHRLSADAYYARGVLAMRENSNLRARLAFKQALAIEPSHAETKKALEDLDR